MLEEIRWHSHVLTLGRYMALSRSPTTANPFREKMVRIAAELWEQ